MPYRRAHVAVWLLLGVTLIAFNPGYLSRLGRSPWQHHRRNPALHGGYLLATPLPLIMAVVTRLPLPLVATGTPLPAAFHPAFNLSIVVMLLCMVVLWRWQPRHPAPFVTIGVATLLEWGGYYLAPAIPGWVAFGVAVAASPTWLVGAIGFGMGTAAVWYGWTSPLRSRVVTRAAEA